jgi:glycogen operon protein
MDFSGTGNSLKCNHAVVRRMIIDCLRYWVEEMHVDGFRFDLASVLSRGEDGRPMADPPILWDIESDPVLANTKIIAEAWDAAGLYEVGTFIGYRWAEWNGKYRDDVRRFVKSDAGMARALAASLTGSRELFARKPGDYNRDPNRSINFVTAHDGFTLNDLVSYNQKHNLANGEENRDGNNTNYSWNGGVEGPTDDPQVKALRSRQVRNFLSILLLSQGAPMFVMGDEIRRTQRGNNNAYVQDNEISWLNWEDIERHWDVLRFVQRLIDLRQSYRIFREETFWEQHSTVHLHWHGVKVDQPDWGYNSHALAMELHAPEYDEHLHIMCNAYWEALDFETPRLPRRQKWYRIIDTSLVAPDDVVRLERATALVHPRYLVPSRSVVVLVAK